MSRGKTVRDAPAPDSSPSPWAPEAVLERINAARGDYLTRTKRDMDWGDIGRALGWKPATVTDVKKGRPLRLAEVGLLAQLLGVSPGWIAFGEGFAYPAENERAWVLYSESTRRQRPGWGAP